MATSTSAPPRTTPSTAPPTAASSTTEPPTGAAQVVYRGDPSHRLVALTFDAGSDAGNTARILDLLATDHIPATFGITGQWANAYPDLLRRIVAGGHQIVNHTFDHPSLTGFSTKTAPLSRSQTITELVQAEQVIQAITGAGTDGWMRPPYGDRNPTVDANVAAAGYRYELMWTVDSLGWEGLAPAQVVARCLGAASPGAIFLLHVGSASTDADALPAVIAGLRSAGFGFATAAQVIA